MATEHRVSLSDRGIAYSTLEFFNAAERGDLEVVKLFVESGMSVDVADVCGYTALHFAALNGHLSVVKVLVERGADMGAKMKMAPGALTLMMAARSCDAMVVRALVDEGVGRAVSAEIDEGVTALMLAAARSGYRRACKDVVEYLESVVGERLSLSGHGLSG